MGKYLDLIRNSEKSSKCDVDAVFASNTGPRKETGYETNEINEKSPEKRQSGKDAMKGGSYELNELHELIPACIFCRQSVERGTPGTGALAGDDLHVDCYWKRYPDGHPLKEEER